MIGYGTLITLSGMAFGGSQKVQTSDGSMKESGSIWEAWAVASSACLLGSFLSFLVLRSVLLTSLIGRKLTRIDSLRDSRQWKAMEKAVGRRGLSMAILVRFSPFPFNMSNLFFASLQSVSLFNFMVATITTTPKLFLHVFIGNKIFQLFDRGARAGLDLHAKILNGSYVVVGGLVGIATSYYVYKETNRILLNYEEEAYAEAMEQGGRSNNQTTSPWLDPSSEERRGFFDGEEGNTGNPQYARRSNSTLWEREMDDDEHQ
ncbi:hypothetical protein CBS101457_006038 [Exobasidium rhododendri]|nr:hypothetical protein CBS101457_006038 [Exobasidium rhododendri]